MERKIGKIVVIMMKIFTKNVADLQKSIIFA